MVFFCSQMKHLQSPTEIFVEVTGQRACKDPDHTRSTFGVPSLVSQLPLPPQPRVGGSHPGNMLHPAPGTRPSCSCSPRPPALQSHASPRTRCSGGVSASLSIQDCAPSSVAIPFLPCFTLAIVFPQYSTSSPNSPLQVNSANTWECTQVSHLTALSLIFSPSELKKGRVAPDASGSPWCNGGAVGKGAFAQVQPRCPKHPSLAICYKVSIY